MKKIILFALLSGLLISCTSFKPIVDTKGRSGTYPTDRASEISDDIQLCRIISNEAIDGFTDSLVWGYNNIFRGFFFWLPPEQKQTRENYMRKCLQNRGHSLLN